MLSGLASDMWNQLKLSSKVFNPTGQQWMRAVMLQNTDHLTFVHGCDSDFVITE